jgi:cell division protein FtsL
MPLFLLNPLILLMKNQTPISLVKNLFLVFLLLFLSVSALCYKTQRDSYYKELETLKLETNIQKMRLEELSKQAEIQNSRVTKSITRIQKEAKNADPKDNDSFNSSLHRTLSRLREIDQNARDSQ